MVYVDFDYYTNTYKGTIPKDSFDSLNIKACREIDKNINTRLNQTKINNLPKEAQDQLKDIACALIDLINRKEESQNRKVSSYSIDGVSKSFNILSDADYTISKKEILSGLPDELTCYI